MPEAMARIAPSQSTEAMARIAPPSPMVPAVRFHSTQDRFFGSKVQIDSKREWDQKGDSTPPFTTTTTTTESHMFTFSLGAIPAESPCGVATFLVNSEP
jgi:hypothetical protein